jgi:hypothetical protein
MTGYHLLNDEKMSGHFLPRKHKDNEKTEFHLRDSSFIPLQNHEGLKQPWLVAQ